MDPFDRSSSITSIPEEEDLGPTSKPRSQQTNGKSILQSSEPQAAGSSGPPSSAPYFASEASGQETPIFNISPPKEKPRAHFNIPDFTITEAPDEEEVDPTAKPPSSKPVKTTRFAIAEEDEEADEEEGKDSEGIGHEHVQQMSPNEKRRPTPYFPEGTRLDREEIPSPSEQRRPTPYFAEGIKFDDESHEPTSIDDHASQSISTRARNLMVSQKMMDKLAYFDTSNEGSMASEESIKPIASKEGKGIFAEQPRRKYRPIRRRHGNKWYNYYSTRINILIVAGILSFIALTLGLSVGIYQKVEANKPGPSATWRPAPGLTWQIQLSTPVTDPSFEFSVYETDLFDTKASEITALHNLGRRVICYFSAGTYENWRPDAKNFQNKTLGSDLTNWAGERWVDIRDKSVRKIMAARIQLAASKGCDGIDPDNVDGFQNNGTGFPLTSTDAIGYIKFLSTTAINNKLSLGLKNSPTIASQVVDSVDWAIVESCVEYAECDYFQPFIQAGRPVLHLEYPDAAGNALFNYTSTLNGFLEAVCTAPGTHLFSTLVKKQSLDDWFLDCPLYVLSGDRPAEGL